MKRDMMFNDDQWRLAKAAAGCENNAKRITQLEEEIRVLLYQLELLQERVSMLEYQLSCKDDQ
jgi:hypothetical protein